MDKEPEIIRQQMEETRSSLAEKLETLEEQVVGTVQDTREAVTETVTSVKEAVQGTVNSLRSTFDIPAQVDRHPWAMFGGSVVVGYLVGHLLQEAERSLSSPKDWRPQPKSDGRQSSIGVQSNGGHRGLEEIRLPTRAAAGSESPRQDVFGQVTGQFGTEISKLKGIAIGTLFAVVRDLLVQSAPKEMAPKLADVIDSVTVKLGGEAFHGPVIPQQSR